MLKSSEDRALAFFESLILTPTGVSQYRERFFEEFEDSYRSTYRSDKDSDIIYIKSGWGVDDDSIKDVEYNFKDFLKANLAIQKKLSKNFIESRASKILSDTIHNNTFFSFIENTLIDLNKQSNTIDYLEVKNTIVDIMQFYHTKYNKYYNFTKEYLDTISVYLITTKSGKTILSFKWKEANKKLELEYLYNSLANATPPFINSSFETFLKAFTFKKLEENESVKWLCKSSKNKKVISKVTLVALLNELYSKNYIISDLNDFNKTTENVFSMPDGVKLKNIKGTKAEKSKSPSRIHEIQAVLDGLSKIA